MDPPYAHLTCPLLTSEWQLNRGRTHGHTPPAWASACLNVHHSAVFWQQVTQVSCHTCLEAHQLSVATYTHKTTTLSPSSNMQMQLPNYYYKD